MENKINNLKRSVLTLIRQRHRPRARVPAPVARRSARPVARPQAPAAPVVSGTAARPTPRPSLRPPYVPGRYLGSPWRQVRAGQPLFRIG